MSKLVDKAMLERLSLAIWAKAKQLVVDEAAARGAQEDIFEADIEKNANAIAAILHEETGIEVVVKKYSDNQLAAAKAELEKADGALEGRIETIEGIVTGKEGQTLGQIIESIAGNTAAINVLNGDENTDGSVAKAVKAEADRAKGVEEGLQGAIDALEEADEDQDALISANDAAIKAEAQTARAAEEALDNRIKAFEQGDNSVANQIKALANRHDEEMTAVGNRVTAVEAFEGRIAANEVFVAAQPAKDKAQDDKIAALEEFVAAQPGVDEAQGERMTVIEGRVDAVEDFVEAHDDTARDKRITDLEEDVARLDGAVEVEGSVKKQIADAVKVEKDRAELAEGDLADRIAANEGLLAGLEKETVQASINQAEADAKAHAEQKIAELVNSAPEAMDTLKELADEISKNQGVYDAYVAEHATAMATMKSDLQKEIDDDVKVVADELAKQKNAEETGSLAHQIAQEVLRAEGEEGRIEGLVTAEAAKAREEEGKLQGQINTINAKDLAQDGRLEALEAVVGLGEEGKDNALDVLEAAVEAAQAAANKAQGEVDAAELRIDALEAANREGGAVAVAIKAAQDAANKAQGEVDAVEGRMDTAEGEIDALQAFVQGHDHSVMEKGIADNKAAIEKEVGDRDKAIEDALAAYANEEEVKAMLGTVINSLGLAISDNKLQLTLGTTDYVIKEVELEMATAADIDEIAAKLV